MKWGGREWQHSAGGTRRRRHTAGVATDALPALDSGTSLLPGYGNSGQFCTSEPEAACELDCLRGIVSPLLLETAESRSREVGLGGDQILSGWGVIDEEAYLQRLALHTGTDFETLMRARRSDSPLLDQDLIRAAEHGLLPLRENGQLIWIVAPRGFAARRVARLVRVYPSLVRRIRLTSSAHLNRFLLGQAANTLAEEASDGLSQRLPGMSAAPVAIKRPWRHRLQRSSTIGGLTALFLLPPGMPVGVSSTLLALWFLAFVGLRLAGSFTPRKTPPKPRALADNELPIYTIIVALYREAVSVAPLLRSLNALDYPREKLNVVIAIEPDDLQTRTALARLGPMPHVQVLIAPASGPRTKPKALNYALPFVRGGFTAVFDAEDRPEPNQLRAALDAFRAHGNEVACAQASLCINNADESWLSRMFMTEYAGQFDVFLPGLAKLGLPLPLGGSSNHFRTEALRKVGGWDAYNVTEDADLGFRLARFGYRSVTFESTTQEEAPARFGGWLRQRSRWMKGWMMTWSVHMRAPLRLWRHAGPGGFFALNIIVGGNVLTALAYPVLLVEVFGHFLRGASTGPAWFLSGAQMPLHLTAIAAGYLSTIVIGLMGLARRGRLRSAWVLVLTPIYWGCLSVAAWRALYQLLQEPYHWEKTEHGLTQDSRPANIFRWRPLTPRLQRQRFQR